MKRYILTLMTLAAASAASAAEPQTGSGETGGYKLVWQDLFDGTQLNADRWYIEANGNGGGNHELQYYARRDENVRVGDDGAGNGCLIITARREEYRGFHFTSGRLNTLGKFGFTHGKVEASIKLPKTANGLWPAFWMMGDDYNTAGWPKCGEIDILEMGNAAGISAGTQEAYFNGACHWGQGWPAASYAQASTRNYSLQDGEFHLYTLIWSDTEVRMYVDLDERPMQTPYFRMNIPQDDPDNEWSPGNYFHKNNFIIFNLAVGGDFTGIHEPENITALNDANGQQACMYVNYVKVYQKGTDDEAIFMNVPGDPQPSTPADDYEGVSGLDVPSVLSRGPVSSVQYLLLDEGSVARFEAAGVKTTDLRPDGVTRNFLVWENTMTEDQPTGTGVGGQTGDHISLTVGNAGWSGAGFNIAAPGFSTTEWNDDTRLHLAYKTGATPCQSIGIIVGDGSGWTPARVALGADFNDNGTIYNTIAPAATDSWQGIDITLGELRRACPTFSYTPGDAWTGNLVSVLAGGTTGHNVALDAVYFYNRASQGIETPEADEASWVITGSTVNVAGAPSVSLYDATGRLVATQQGSTLDTEGIAPGLYIGVAAGMTRKLIIR